MYYYIDIYIIILNCAIKFLPLMRVAKWSSSSQYDAWIHVNLRQNPELTEDLTKIRTQWFCYLFEFLVNKNLIVLLFVCFFFKSRWTVILYFMLMLVKLNFGIYFCKDLVEIFMNSIFYPLLLWHFKLFICHVCVKCFYARNF